MTIRVVGASGLIRSLADLGRSVNSEVADEMEDIAEDLEADVIPVTPRLSGELREAWYSDVSRAANGPRMEAGFNGPPEYLLVQHEGGWENLIAWGHEQGPTRIEHYTTPGTGPKFLERPWLNNKSNYKARVKRAVRRGLRG